MSVLSPKRVVQFVAATLLALPLFANNPSPRMYPRMAFDEQSGVGVLFGGRGSVDPADGLTHATDETWLWIRTQWVQQFPVTRPPARSEHVMVYDSRRDRIILFGGRQEATVVRQKAGYFGDTWAWKDGEWTDLAPGDAPSPRVSPGMAYDSDRDRVILFGGLNASDDGKTVQPRQDTWEFDGDNWTRVSSSGPLLGRPMLVYDRARHETLLVGLAQDFSTGMYRWDPASSSWTPITPAAKPGCVSDAGLVYQAHNERVLIAGGNCGAAAFIEETWEWDGTNWTKAKTNGLGRVGAAALAYDTATQTTVRFGGVSSISTSPTTPDEGTRTYKNGRWREVLMTVRPAPRSMSLFRRDPQQGGIWLLGGLSQFSYGDAISYLDDFWHYRDGQWALIAQPDAPKACETPAGAMDTDRNVLVVVCGGSSVFEWNGATWKKFERLDPAPDARRFTSLVYDQTLKKIVMFGGYEFTRNYLQDTWTWNGTAWTEVKPKKKPPHRAQGTMWYDPLAKKTILYSGAGRASIEDRATRYSDMWSFDGTTWTELSKTAAPGIRFAPQITVDPVTGKVLLFGGLRATIDENGLISQFYDNDTWVWDGQASKWTELNPENAPGPRQNAAFDYDSESGKFVLFGGFAGNIYLSDRWVWDGQNWTVVPDTPAVRGRPTRH